MTGAYQHNGSIEECSRFLSSMTDSEDLRATDFDVKVNDWLKKNNVGINQYTELSNMFIELNVQANYQAIQSALTKERQRIVAAIPRLRLDDVIKADQFPKTTDEYEKMLWVMNWTLYQMKQAINNQQSKGE